MWFSGKLPKKILPDGTPGEFLKKKNSEGIPKGTPDEISNGTPEGTVDLTHEGTPEGIPFGTPGRSSNRNPWGILFGTLQRIAQLEMF